MRFILLLLIALDLYANEYKIGDIISFSSKELRKQVVKIDSLTDSSKKIHGLIIKKNILLHDSKSPKNEFESIAEYKLRLDVLEAQRSEEIKKIDQSINELQSANIDGELTLKYISIVHPYPSGCSCNYNKVMTIKYNTEQQKYQLNLPEFLPIMSNVNESIYVHNSFMREAPKFLAFKGRIYTINNPFNNVTFKYPLSNAKLIKHDLGFLFVVKYKDFSIENDIVFNCKDEFGDYPYLYREDNSDEVKDIRLEVEVKKLIVYDLTSKKIVFIFDQKKVI